MVNGWVWVVLLGGVSADLWRVVSSIPGVSATSSSQSLVSQRAVQDLDFSSFVLGDAGVKCGGGLAVPVVDWWWFVGLSSRLGKP